MYLRIGLCLLLTICCAGSMAAEIRVSECRGVHGERVFSDSAECAGASVRQWILPLQPATAAPAVAGDDDQKPQRLSQSRVNRSARATRPPDSYQCSTGDQTWYQHGPCRSAGGRAGSVRQARVSREHACREIERPASALRNGSERDERAGPYARASGRDPCR